MGRRHKKMIAREIGLWEEFTYGTLNGIVADE